MECNRWCKLVRPVTNDIHISCLENRKIKNRKWGCSVWLISNDHFCDDNTPSLIGYKYNAGISFSCAQSKHI